MGIISKSAFVLALSVSFILGAQPAQAGGGGDKDVDTVAEKYWGSTVKMDPMILPIIDNNGVSQTISFVVTLEAIDVEAAKEAREISPRLASKYWHDIYDFLNKKASLQGGEIEIDYMKRRIYQVTSEVMGRDIIDDIIVEIIDEATG